MVSRLFDELPISSRLSVLALSSRFDGPIAPAEATQLVASFSTRSVESF